MVVGSGVGLGLGMGIGGSAGGVLDHYHYDVMGGGIGTKWNIYMETSCFRVFMLLNDMKAYVSMYFLQLMVTFPPKNNLMVKDKQ